MQTGNYYNTSSYGQGKSMRLFLILVLWHTSFISYAAKYTGEVDPKRATAAEMVRLPELCQLRFKYGHGSREFLRWEKVLGPESLHVHHYCDGLVDLMRLNKRKKYWQGVLHSAKSNFNYVLVRVQNPNFVLFPDLYYRMAIVSVEEDNSAAAITYANKSIQKKKNYLNPYLLLAEIYIKSGKKEKAKKTLLEAQKYHPNSKRVKDLLKEI